MLLAVLVACAPSPSPAAPAPAPAPSPSAPRTVAIGDVHGDPDALERVLRLGRLVDEAGAWVGGDTTLVFTGDLFDRGPSSKQVVARVRAVQAAASHGGGRVVVLLGNHEVMNLQGDWRYVSPEDVAEFGGEDARRAALAGSADLGDWLRGLDATALVDGTVFVHGGIDAHWASLGLDALNTQIRAAIGVTPQPAILGTDGPLWNRAYLLSDPAQACPELDKALAELGAKRMVVGHTRQDDGRIAERCGGKLYGIDTGLSSYYGGRHDAALELRGDVATPLYGTPR